MGTVFFLKCQGTEKKKKKREKETRFSLILIILILHRASIQKYIYVYIYLRIDDLIFPFFCRCVVRRETISILIERTHYVINELSCFQTIPLCGSTLFI